MMKILKITTKLAKCSNGLTLPKWSWDMIHQVYQGKTPKKIQCSILLVRLVAQCATFSEKNKAIQILGALWHGN